jgi:hypothetical protein
MKVATQFNRPMNTTAAMMPEAWAIVSKTINEGLRQEMSFEPILIWKRRNIYLLILN